MENYICKTTGYTVPVDLIKWASIKEMKGHCSLLECGGKCRESEFTEADIGSKHFVDNVIVTCNKQIDICKKIIEICNVYYDDIYDIKRTDDMFEIMCPDYRILYRSDEDVYYLYRREEGGSAFTKDKGFATLDALMKTI